MWELNRKSMAVSTTDVNQGSLNVIIAILATLAVVYILLMTSLYGTLSISTAGKNYKHKSDLEEVHGSKMM